MTGEARIARAAVQDLAEIASYIGERNESAGIRFYLTAKRQINLLAHTPYGGPRFYKRRHPRLSELRFWPIRRYRKYLIFYLPTESGVEILRVLHGARNLKKVIRDSL